MLEKLLRKNRSYRTFDSKEKLSTEMLKQFIEATRIAPSSANIQPLKYYIVNKPEIVEQVQKSTKWAGRLKDTQLPPNGMGPTAFIVICHDTTVAPYAETFLKDVGIVAHTILLSATEAGYGGCMIGSFNTAEIVNTLGLAPTFLPLLVLAIGKPMETVKLIDAKDGDIAYYREDGVHYTPKRLLTDIIINN